MVRVSRRRLLLFIGLAGWLAVAVARPTAQQSFVVGANVNMVKAPNDPTLQRQVEGAIAIGTRNPCHLMGAGIDYRLTVDPGLITETLDSNLTNPENATGDAWNTVYTSLDCGQRWQSKMIHGYPG